MRTDSTSTSNLYFLIGFMGSGKSLLSRGVQQSVDLLTIEMDEEIERTAGCSINEIFAREGEKGFRKREQSVLNNIIDQYQFIDKIVLVSTGGGAPCHFNNMEIMNTAGTTIFINPSAERLSERLEQKKEERPLIKDLSTQELQAYIKNTLAKRLPYYSQATIMVNMINDDKNQNIEFLKDIVMAER